MPDSPADSAADLRRCAPWLATLVIMVGVAIVARAWINFGPAVPPGMDAGYYVVQVRSLLDHGRLQWSDVPLRFAIDAALARPAMAMCGWSVDEAALWSTRAVDSTAQPLVAVTVFLATFAWSGGRRGALPVAIAASAVATLSGPILRMTGDFGKQSLAMVFMAAAWVAFASVLSSTTRFEAIRRGLVMTALLALTALSHAGTFGAAALGVAMSMAAWAMRGGVTRTRLLQALLVMLVLGGLMLGAVWLLAPTKAEALLRAPLTLFGRGDAGGMPGRMPGGPGRPGGPPGLVGPGAIAWIVALLGAALALRWATRRTEAEPGDERRARATVSLALGLTLTAAFLTCPLLNPEYGMRLSIMAPVPAALVLAFLLSRPRSAGASADGWRSAIPPSLCGMLVIASIASGIVAGRRARDMQLISEEGLAELRSWRDEVNAGGPGVVAARHGLEFWAAFALDCDARLDRLSADDFDRYRRRYVLVQDRGAGRLAVPGPPDGPGPSTASVPDGANVAKRGDRFTLYEVPDAARPGIGR